MRRKKQISKNSVLLAGLSLTLLACTDDNSKKQKVDVLPAALLENYSFTSQAFYPEGIDFDKKNNRFIISSFNKGVVYSLSPDGKTFAPFITDDNLIAALGVYTDETNDRIIVASGDAGASEKSGANGSTAGQKAYVGFYNAKAGTLIKGVDLKPLVLAGGVFPNDITIDENGNVYVTDSFSPVIYKIDKNYNVAIFVNNNSFAAPAGSFGLNGIVYKNGYLIVAQSSAGKLFKIKLSDQSVSEIAGLENVFKAPDGLEWSGDNLTVIENGLGEGKAYLLSGKSDWTSASKIKEVVLGKKEFPTTAYAADNGVVYVLQSYLGKLLGGDKTQTEYQIKGLKF
ncbi:SBBP repeat-containing protein [Flavobacterium collinsii]|uniref:SMP-30/Gluconolactonase/LRE-like region domain-containing protein n=1 Tax=Flavobacterium collinsii TaxID=1114861 RepID=A0A9W4TFP9_9FLAO|nr:SBBP repeat-containing protein [Flavobacterium collinsii]CAA9200897.1 hypothetical protein FLACOL7796_03506 [Flavobacterium collinsii]CAI2767170.1 conserved exported protein of unknown function [Flavobacterium collinsii]